MVSKLQEYRRMSEEAQRQLTGSLERWQSFLATASRLYKYPYHEQVMIHAQRPDATACAEFDVWNNTMRRYVRRGSKGIALIDTSGDRERLRYVFDVSDTGTRPNSRSLNLWELREEHLPIRPICPMWRHSVLPSRRIWTLLKLRCAWEQPGLTRNTSSSLWRKPLSRRITCAGVFRYISLRLLRSGASAENPSRPTTT